MLILNPQRWREAPTEPVEIDWSHPLAAGLKAFLIPARAGRIYDPVLRDFWTQTNGASFGSSAGRAALINQGNVAASGYSTPVSTQWGTASSFTVDGLFSHNNISSHQISILLVVGPGTEDRVYLGRNHNSTETFFGFQVDGSTWSEVYAPGQSVALGQPYTTACSYNLANNAFSIYHDSVSNTNFAAGAPIDRTNSAFRVQSQGAVDATYSGQTNTHYARYWNRVLSSDELLLARTEPFALLRPRKTTLYYLSALPSGAIFHQVQVTASGQITQGEWGTKTGSLPQISGPTRLYLPYSTSSDASISPSYTTGWDQTTSTIRNRMSTSRGSTAITNVVLTKSVTTNNYDMLFRQYVSDPFSWDMTVSGTVKGAIRGVTSVNANNAFINQVVKLVDSSGGNERILYALGTSTATNNAWEFTTAAGVRSIPAGAFGTTFTLTDQTAVAGDRLVVEIGARLNTTTSGVTSTLAFGDNQASDIPETTTTSTLNPWIEFSTAIPLNHAYRQVYIITPANVLASGSASATSDHVGSATLEHTVSTIASVRSEAIATASVNYTHSVSASVGSSAIVSISIPYSASLSVVIRPEPRVSPSLSYSHSVSASVRPDAFVTSTLSYTYTATAFGTSGEDVPSGPITIGHSSSVLVGTVSGGGGYSTGFSSGFSNTGGTVSGGVSKEAQVELPLMGYAASVVASSDQSVFALVTLPYTVMSSASGTKGALVQISLSHTLDEEVSVEPRHQVQASVIGLNHEVEAQGTAHESVFGVAAIEQLSQTAASVAKEAKVVPAILSYSAGVTAEAQLQAEVSITLSSTVAVSAQATFEARIAVALPYTHSVQTVANVDKRVTAVASHPHAIEAFYSLEETSTVVASTSVGAVSVSAEIEIEAKTVAAIGNTLSLLAEVLPEARVSPSVSYSHSTDAVVDVVKAVIAVVSANQNVAAFYSPNETIVATAFTNAGSVSISAQVRPEARTGITIPNSLAVSVSVKKEVQIQPLWDHEFQQVAEVRTEHFVEIPPIVLSPQIAVVSFGEGDAGGIAFLSHDVVAFYVGEGKPGGFGNGFSSGFPAHEPGVGGFKDVLVEPTSSGSLSATAQVYSEARVSLTVASLQSVGAEIEVAKEDEAVIVASHDIIVLYVPGETTTAHASVNVGDVGVSAEVRSESRASVAVATSVSVSANIGTDRLVEVDIISHDVFASASGSANENVQSVALIEYNIAASATFTKRIESGALLLLSASQSAETRTERLNSAAIALTAETQVAGTAEGAGSASPVVGLLQQIQASATKAVEAEAAVPHIAGIVVGSHTAAEGTAQISHILAVSASGMRGFSTTASVGIMVDIAALVGKTARVPTTTAYVTDSSAAGVKSARLSISATAIASVVGEISVEKRAAALYQAVDSVQTAFHTERFSDASTALLLSGYAQGVTVPPDLMLGKIPISGTSDAVYDLTGQVTSVVSLIGTANQAS